MEAFEIFKQQKTKVEDFANICLSGRIQAVSFLFVQSFDEGKNVILPFSALPENKKIFIAKEFKTILNDVIDIQSRYALIVNFYSYFEFDFESSYALLFVISLSYYLLSYLLDIQLTFTLFS